MWKRNSNSFTNDSHCQTYFSDWEALIKASPHSGLKCHLTQFGGGGGSGKRLSVLQDNTSAGTGHHKGTEKCTYFNLKNRMFGNLLFQPDFKKDAIMMLFLWKGIPR